MRDAILMRDNRLLEVVDLEDYKSRSLDEQAERISAIEPASTDRWMITVYTKQATKRYACYYIGTTKPNMFWWISDGGEYLFLTEYNENVDTDMSDQTLYKAAYAWPIERQLVTEFRDPIR